MSEVIDFKKVLLIYLQIYATCNFLQIYLCALFYCSTNPFLLEIDIHVRYTMMHVWNNRFSKK